MEKVCVAVPSGSSDPENTSNTFSGVDVDGVVGEFELWQPAHARTNRHGSPIDLRLLIITF
jgi:hypothetical protein